MRSLEFTFRRKYGEGENKTPYGNSTEMVAVPGQKEQKEVPCFRVNFARAPENYDELIKDIGGESQFSKFVDAIYEAGIKESIKSNIFLKLEKGAENSEQERLDVIRRVEQLVNDFTYSAVIADTLTAKSALDELNSPEMQELARTDQAEFARRVTQILQSTRGVKAT